jgi:hypothetical protein
LITPMRALFVDTVGNHCCARPHEMQLSWTVGIRTATILPPN